MPFTPPTRTTTGPRPAGSAWPATLVVLMALAAIGQAQSGLAGLTGSGGGDLLVDREQVLESAHEAFARTLGRRLGQITRGDSDPVDEDTLEALVDRELAGFRAAAEVLLDDLGGDGLLLADEVSPALGDLREEHLEHADEDLAALQAGRPPPPRADTVSDALTRWREMAHYVLVVRNGWERWATLGAALAIGLGLAMAVLHLTRRQAASGERDRQRLVRTLMRSISELDGPLYMLCLAGGLAVGLGAVWLPAALREPVRTVLVSLILASLFWSAWRLSGTATRRLGQWATPSDSSPGEQVLEIVRKLVRLGLITLFAFLGVELLFGADLTTLVAGLGIAGVAVTLAAQDTLKDLLAALTLHANHPFGLGDLVRFEGHLGTVEEVGFRMTRLRTLDGHQVSVPNNKLVSDLVENLSARDWVRRRFHVDLPYHSPPGEVERATELIRGAIQDQGDLHPDHDVQVHFDELGGHSLRVLVQYCTRQGDYWEAKRQAHAIDLELVRRFEDEGLAFAFPTHTVHLEGGAPSEPDGSAPDPETAGRSGGEQVRSDHDDGAGRPSGASAGVESDADHRPDGAADEAGRGRRVRPASDGPPTRSREAPS